MSKKWRWKAILVVLLTLFGVYQLIPTVLKFNKEREALEEAGKPLPLYLKLFPKEVLNLGLDLRGGIYIEMEVDLKNAIKRRTDIFATDIESYLNDKKITFAGISQPNDDGRLYIKTDSVEDMNAIKQLISSDWRETFVVESATTENNQSTLIVKFNDEYKSFFEGRAVEQALETIRNRIDRYGVSEPTILKQGSNRIAIELPGLDDPERAINIIKKTGQLDFKIVDETINQATLTGLVDETRKNNNLPDNYSADTVEKINNFLEKNIPEGTEIAFELQRDPVTKNIVKGTPYLLQKKAEVTGDMLQNAMVSVHDNEPYVDLSLDKRGTKLFADLTGKNVGKKLAIVLDGNVMKAPVIKEAIPQGRAQITLGYGGYGETMKEAEDLVLVLQEGALPARLIEAAKNIVGPTLGYDSIRDGIRASLIAAIVVILFMIIYYNFSGLWADLALMVNLLLVLAILAVFQATLTLPGIAGIVLTIGMAVDANVLINERIREELRAGRTPRESVENGYKHALSAIIDSNITTLITGIILYQYGTGPIRGFAVTLCIGILTTLFTSIVITKLIFEHRVIKGKVQKLSI